MLALDAVLRILNDSSYKCEPFIVQWQNIYYRMSLHTTGACPSFRNLRFNCGEHDETYDTLVKPIGWIDLKYDWIFDNFLLNRHPREPEVTRQWRKSQYKPYTQAPFQQVIDKACGTIFADSNYSLKVEDEEDNEYVNGNNFHGKSLVEYVASQLQTICEDPNSIYVTIPAEPYYKTTTKKIEPKVYNIPTRNIIWFSGDEIIFYYLDYAWLINNVGYFRFQKEEGTDLWVNVDGLYGGYYAHLMARTPKHFAGGIWNTRGWFESYLRAGQAWADDFVSSKSAEQLVNKEASHPFIIEASNDCSSCDGTGKTQYCKTCNATASTCECEEHDGWNLGSCKTCGGQGQMSWNPADRKIAPPEEMGNKLIQIENPNVAVNEFHAKNNAEIYNGIMRSLHQQYIEQAQSGKAKEKDMEGQYLFLQKMSDGLFHLIECLLIDILSLRNTTTQNGIATVSPSSYVIVKPTQFAIKTEGDLLEEYKIATESKLPDFLRQRQMEELVDKLYGGDAAMKKMTMLINRLDSMAVTAEGDKQIKVTNGAVSKRDYQFSTVLPKIIYSIIQDKGNEWFIAATYEQIETLINSEFAKIPEVKEPEPTVIDRNTV